MKTKPDGASEQDVAGESLYEAFGVLSACTDKIGRSASMAVIYMMEINSLIGKCMNNVKITAESECGDLGEIHIAANKAKQSIDEIINASNEQSAALSRIIIRIDT